MLTLEKLKEFGPNEVIDQGTIIDSPEGLHMTGSGKMLRWVAVSGRSYHDWTIYCHFADHSTEHVKRWGDKVIGSENIKKLVPCDVEAFEMYRL